jgi:phosphatidylglycerophosphate synthase
VVTTTKAVVEEQLFQHSLKPGSMAAADHSHYLAFSTMRKAKEGEMPSRDPSEETWMTKPSDRFILKWIKCTVSARVTPLLASRRRLRPWMVTVTSAIVGVGAGVAFALGWGVLAGLAAGFSQILDGVDGQLARLRGSESKAGAFLDSVLDRYTDGALVIGLAIYTVSLSLPLWVVGVIGALAFIGSGLISYSTARSESLGLDLGKPTLASKGTRTSVIAISGVLSPTAPIIPFVALCYLALHTNIVVLSRIGRVFRYAEPR